MRIKRIKLRNIRSYQNQEIDFPKGSVLISGDIGSGKTSVLLGIEFALFGLQPGQRGSSLLRNGEMSGNVEMEFEVDESTVVVKRDLKRNRTISQGPCHIFVNGEKREVSVMEMKSIVLDLLKYPKEFSKRQNTLYKFTVYTPQEEMKQIILQDNETRTNILRHVFGIDRYKRVIENTSLLTSKMREEIRLKEGMTFAIDEDRANILSKENELESKNLNLSSLEKEYFLRTEERKKAQEDKDIIEEKILEKQSLQREVEKKRIILSSKEEILSSNISKIDALKRQINEIKDLKFDSSKIKELEERIREAKSKKEGISDEIISVSSQATSLSIKNQEIHSMKEKISHLKNCPTCLQEVNSMYKANIMSKFDSDIKDNAEKMEAFKGQREGMRERLLGISSEIDSYEKEMLELNILGLKMQGIHEKHLQIEDMEKHNAEINKDMSRLNLEIGAMQKLISEMGRFDAEFEEKRIALEAALNSEKNAEIKIAELKKEIQVFSTQIDELKERLKRTEQVKSQLHKIRELEGWLSEKFTPLVSFIEKTIMASLKKEFSKLFSEWFSMLVPESFNVRLSDDFTPIIEQRDFEIDYQHLSGGERTAIALAYRLSLNQIINSLMSNIKTRDIIILDEPTDGFSSQQLDKMRDVLNELNVGQLIIVSHEPKIEAFVDNVIKFRKENGISVVESQ